MNTVSTTQLCSILLDFAAQMSKREGPTEFHDLADKIAGCLARGGLKIDGEQIALSLIANAQGQAAAMNPYEVVTDHLTEHVAAEMDASVDEVEVYRTVLQTLAGLGTAEARWYPEGREYLIAVTAPKDRNAVIRCIEGAALRLAELGYRRARLESECGPSGEFLTLSVRKRFQRDADYGRRSARV